MQNDINNIETKLVSLQQKYINFKKNLAEKIKEIEEQHKDKYNGRLFLSPKTAENVGCCIDKVKHCVTNKMLLELKEHFRITKTTAPFENRKIKRFSKKVIDILETSFRSDRYPSEEEKNRIANLCLISVKQVNNWFTNKRNRSKQYDVNIYRDY